MKPDTTTPLKKLTARDLALGLGRKATEEELSELLNRPTGKGKDIEQVRKEVKETLKRKRQPL